MSIMWTNSDWDSQSTDIERLARLRLYIAELLEYALKIQSAEFESELNREILPILFKERERLINVVGATTTVRFGGRNRARFSNV